MLKFDVQDSEKMQAGRKALKAFLFCLSDKTDSIPFVGRADKPKVPASESCADLGSAFDGARLSPPIMSGGDGRLPT